MLSCYLLFCYCSDFVPKPLSATADGSAAVLATLKSPTGVRVDSLGNIYIAETGNNAIRKISPTGNGKFRS